MKSQPDNSYPWVREVILAALSCTTQPVPRDQLTERVLDYSFEHVGLRWKRLTAARRVRDAFKQLRRQGYPVVSDGTGFKLATTTEERHRAAEKMRKMARDLFNEAAQLEAASVPREPTQRSFEGTPGFEVRP